MFRQGEKEEGREAREQRETRGKGRPEEVEVEEEKKNEKKKETLSAFFYLDVSHDGPADENVLHRRQLSL